MCRTQTLAVLYINTTQSDLADIVSAATIHVHIGALAVNDKPLTRIEVHGKNLFYFFGEESDPKVVHIHFGMSGAFKTMTLPGPEPTDTTRLTLVNKDLDIIASLSAMTVVLGDLGESYKASALLVLPCLCLWANCQRARP